MSDKRRRAPKICANCARIDSRQLDRRYCPVTASVIHPGRSAESCRFYVEAEEGWDFVKSRHGGRRRDVRDE